MLILKEGDFLVKSARRTVEEYAEKHSVPAIEHDKKFDAKSGVFVTLEHFPDLSLRGCIGYPEPVMPFFRAMQDSAVNAACFDPRFEPVQPWETKELVVEVTVLTPPELIKVKDPKELPSKITVGKHGLIVRYGPFNGLLLPQVAVEQKWNATQFLENTCWKANLSQDMWLDRNTSVYRFEGQVFSETSPGGKVVEKKG